MEKMAEFFDKRAVTYEYHMIREMELAEFFNEIELCVPKKDKIKVLDLGCGTGLQAERIFKVNPDAELCGIDLSSNMLEVFREKFKDKNINLICGSYLDVDFGKEMYDFVISTYSFHHFFSGTKLKLYKRIYESLKKGGIFAEGDYVADTAEKEQYFLDENTNLGEGIYHHDIPLFFESQFNLYREAGFGHVEIKKRWENTTIFVCKKENDL